MFKDSDMEEDDEDDLFGFEIIRNTKQIQKKSRNEILSQNPELGGNARNWMKMTRPLTLGLI